MEGAKFVGPRLKALGAALCALLGLAAPAWAAESATSPAHITPPDVFGTVALAAPTKRIAARWYRVRSFVPTPAIFELVEPVRGLDRDRQLLFVQSVVQRILAYREDDQMWGQPDYWATAAETMARGGGDCEDLAIVKYQALLALGFAPDTLALSIGRDEVRGDHALLLVRLGATWWVLDNDRPRPMQAHQRTGFEPVLSFSGGAAQWLHGRARPAASTPQPAARR